MFENRHILLHNSNTTSSLNPIFFQVYRNILSICISDFFLILFSNMRGRILQQKVSKVPNPTFEDEALLISLHFFFWEY